MNIEALEKLAEGNVNPYGIGGSVAGALIGHMLTRPNEDEKQTMWDKVKHWLAVLGGGAAGYYLGNNVSTRKDHDILAGSEDLGAATANVVGGTMNAAGLAPLGKAIWDVAKKPGGWKMNSLKNLGLGTGLEAGGFALHGLAGWLRDKARERRGE